MEKLCKLSIQSIYKSMFLTIELDIIKTWPLVSVSVKGKPIQENQTSSVNQENQGEESAE